MGTDFSESIFDQVTFQECLCSFANFAFMHNKTVQFQHCCLQNASFVEVKMTKTSFDECDLRQCEFLHASLSHIDLSSCQTEGIMTSSQDIAGAIIAYNQAPALIHLLKVKIKE